MVCYDEFGPIELRPQHGQTWARQRHPDRLPATYTRRLGTQQLLAFYDLRRDRMWGYLRPHKRWADFLRVLKKMRNRYPVKERIYLVLDNFAPHRRAEVRRWARMNNVIFVWTPTNASWLNRIECQFTELKGYAFHNTYFRTHQQVRKAISRFLRYRNHRNAKRKYKKTNLKRH